LPILTHCAEFLESIDVDATEAMPQGLLISIGSAVHSAGQIRDRFSPDGWLALNDLQKTAQRFATRIGTGDDATRAMTVLLRKLAGFSGLVHENMYRFAGWRFLEIGRRLERAIQIARITGWLTGDDAPDGSLEMLLEIGDSVMSHRRRYSVTAGTQSAIDLLVLDPLNPRSVLFQLTELLTQLETLPGGIRDGQLSGVAKAALQLQTRLITAEPETMTPDKLDEISNEIGLLASLIAAHYFT
ncbi:MAG: alpha-E domain-containing protein, partial [Devosia sp.]|uniref:alpha-E domain-containing protein n=1 Tax=Devosia sp. TaxID=1871048 RepID=UPI00339B4916